MTAIGQLVAPIVARAMDMARRQRILAQLDDPVVKKIIIVRWGTLGDITAEEAELLIESNGLEAA